VEFRILGPLEVEGVPSLGGPKQRALLAQLVLAAGEPVPASRLVDEVWGEQPPAGAQRSVEVYVSRLRQEIASTGAEIVRRGSGYELVLGSARVDLREFRSLAREGRESLAAGDPKTAHARLQEALALWRGPALADIDGRSGVELDEERLAAAEDLADAELSLGRHGELVPVLERRAREEPLRERTRAQLMLALYRSGRQADALAAYRVARSTRSGSSLERSCGSSSGRFCVRKRRSPWRRRSGGNAASSPRLPRRSSAAGATSTRSRSCSAAPPDS